MVILIVTVKIFYFEFFLALKCVSVEQAKVVFEKTRKFKKKPLEEIVDTVKKMPKSLKFNVRPGSTDPTSDQRYSPGGRRTGSPFQQAPTSIIKAKTLKSPTPIMPGGHKRPAEHDQHGK